MFLIIEISDHLMVKPRFPQTHHLRSQPGVTTDLFPSSCQVSWGPRAYPPVIQLYQIVLFAARVPSLIRLYAIQLLIE